MVEIEETKTP